MLCNAYLGDSVQCSWATPPRCDSDYVLLNKIKKIYIRVRLRVRFN